MTGVSWNFKDCWDMPDPDAFPVQGMYERTLDGGIHGGVSTIRHHYVTPGTYFVSVCITTNRDGNEKVLFTQVKNLDRVRIIVE